MLKILSRIKEGLSKSRQVIASKLSTLFLGKKEIDAALLAELSKHLLEADLGPKVTRLVLAKLTDMLHRKELRDGEVLWAALKNILIAYLEPYAKPLVIGAHKPHVIMMVGVNGNGKTTTIGKLGFALQDEGKRVMLAAGDTFRAAATEQLEAWGARFDIPVIAQHQGADAASVLFDAYQSACAQSMDVLLADTAGRLHTKAPLMDELKKMKRVLGKLNPDAPHDVFLVLDATTGQNALAQARIFKAELGLTGLILTKLDGTAKGGVVFSICSELELPVVMIGVGEAPDDLKPFEAVSFVEGLLGGLDEHQQS